MCWDGKSSARGLSPRSAGLLNVGSSDCVQQKDHQLSSANQHRHECEGSCERRAFCLGSSDPFEPHIILPKTYEQLHSFSEWQQYPLVLQHPFHLMAQLGMVLSNDLRLNCETTLVLALSHGSHAIYKMALIPTICVLDHLSGLMQIKLWFS